MHRGTVIRGYRILGLGAMLLAMAWQATPAAAIETTAPAALLVDHETDTVLFEKDADRPVPPASLAKLMTVAVAFDALESGRIELTDSYTVSEHAWRTGGASSGGSTMFLPLNSSATVEELLKGIIIQSGNDASIVLAEGMAGSVEVFADLMNRTAKSIGLAGSHFTNPHGLPDPDQHVTLRDLALLASYLVDRHPERFAWFAEPEYTFNDIRQFNRNPLLGLGIGADGLKTGYTEAAGYSFVGTAKKDGRRLIVALTGMKSADERKREALKLLTWGFGAFEEVTVAPAGAVVGKARVAGGALPEVELVTDRDVIVLVPRGSDRTNETSIQVETPLEPPVITGQRVGTLRIGRDDTVLAEVPVLAGHDVQPAGFFQRAWDAVVLSVMGE